jgi:hypothetical protein
MMTLRSLLLLLGEKSRITVNKGEELRLRFGVLIYEVPESETADLAAAYRSYVKGPANGE